MKKITENNLSFKLQKSLDNRTLVEVALNTQLSVIHVKNTTVKPRDSKNNTLIKVAKELGVTLEVRENINGKEFWC